jgi:hypothetical protein
LQQAGIVLQEGSLDSKEDSEGTPEETVERETTENSSRKDVWIQERLGKIFIAPGNLTAKQSAEVPGSQPGGSLDSRKEPIGGMSGECTKEDAPQCPSPQDRWTQERLGKIHTAPASLTGKHTVGVPELQQGGSPDSPKTSNVEFLKDVTPEELPQQPFCQSQWNQECLGQYINFTAPGTLTAKPTLECSESLQMGSQEDLRGTLRETPQKETHDYSSLQKLRNEGLCHKNNECVSRGATEAARAIDTQQDVDPDAQAESRMLRENPGKSSTSYSISSLRKPPTADWPNKLITNCRSTATRATEVPADSLSHGTPPAS